MTLHRSQNPFERWEYMSIELRRIKNTLHCSCIQISCFSFNWFPFKSFLPMRYRNDHELYILLPFNRNLNFCLIFAISWFLHVFLTECIHLACRKFIQPSKKSCRSDLFKWKLLKLFHINESLGTNPFSILSINFIRSH